LRAASSDVSRLHTQLSKAEEAGDKAAIIELSRRIVAIAPNDSDAWETLAQTQLDIEDLDRLAQTLDAWQKVRRPPAAIEDFRGDLCLKRKDYQNAERHWLAFLATKPRAADAATDYDKLADLCVTQARWPTTRLIGQRQSRRRIRPCVVSSAHALSSSAMDAVYADMAKRTKSTLPIHK
jgi:tetratricopeptide (TPR) repeat protein